jgi:hypothetical protein
VRKEMTGQEAGVYGARRRASKGGARIVPLFFTGLSRTIRHFAAGEVRLKWLGGNELGHKR